MGDEPEIEKIRMAQERDGWGCEGETIPSMQENSRPMLTGF